MEAVSYNNADALSKTVKNAAVNFMGLVDENDDSRVFVGANSGVFNVKELDKYGSTTAALNTLV